MLAKRPDRDLFRTDRWSGTSARMWFATIGFAVCAVVLTARAEATGSPTAPAADTLTHAAFASTATSKTASTTDSVAHAAPKPAASNAPATAAAAAAPHAAGSKPAVTRARRAASGHAATSATNTGTPKPSATTAATTAATSTTHPTAPAPANVKPASPGPTAAPAAKAGAMASVTTANPISAAHGMPAAKPTSATTKPATSKPAATTPAPVAQRPFGAALPGQAKPMSAKTPPATGSAAIAHTAAPGAKVAVAPTTIKAVSMTPTVVPVGSSHPVTGAPAVSPVPGPEAAGVEEQVIYHYNALGRRDPFAPLVGGGYVGADEQQAPPDPGGIKVVGIVWGADDKFALVEDPRGNSRVLRQGDKVMNGVVDGLRRDAVIVKLTTEGGTELVQIPLTRKGDSNANH